MISATPTAWQCRAHPQAKMLHYRRCFSATTTVPNPKNRDDRISWIPDPTGEHPALSNITLTKTYSYFSMPILCS